MAIVKLTTSIDAPIQRCFDLSRDIGVHARSMSRYKEEPVRGKGKTTGLLEFGDVVTWRAVHFGIKQKLAVKITAFAPPNYFRDTMQQGAFARFDHDHYFKCVNNQCVMIDIFDFNSPLGILGLLAENLFLTKYMKRLLEDRNKLIKTIAESDYFFNGRRNLNKSI